ncbi:hypothetical protein EV122DRAFT_254795 [Schizophyllum commune]|nr:hypothetical protein K523DRAFT_365875 [Schizophyllum commune Tattone D]
MIGNSMTSLAKSIQILALVEDILAEITMSALSSPMEESSDEPERKRPRTLPGGKGPIGIGDVASAAVLAQVLLYDSTSSTAGTSQGANAADIEMAQPGTTGYTEKLPNDSPVTTKGEPCLLAGMARADRVAVRPLKDSCWRLYVALNSAQYSWENLHFAPSMFFSYLVIVATSLIRGLLGFYALASITAIQAIWTRSTLPSTMAVTLAVLLFGVGLFKVSGLLQKKLVGLCGSLRAVQKDVASLRTDVLNIILLYKRLLAAISLDLDAVEVQEPPDNGTAQMARMRRILADKCLRTPDADVAEACEEALSDIAAGIR